MLLKGEGMCSTRQGVAGDETNKVKWITNPHKFGQPPQLSQSQISSATMGVERPTEPLRSHLGCIKPMNDDKGTNLDEGSTVGIFTLIIIMTIACSVILAHNTHFRFGKSLAIFEGLSRGVNTL